MKLTVEELLKMNLKGKTILFQTEKGSVLGCLLNDELAIEKLYAITRHMKTIPFPVLTGTIEDAYALVRYPKHLRPYALFYWPGPVTLVTKKKSFVQDFVSRGHSQVGIWVSKSPIAKTIANHFGPLVVATRHSFHKEKSSAIKDMNVFESSVDYCVKGENVLPESSFVFDVDNNAEVSKYFH